MSQQAKEVKSVVVNSIEEKVKKAKSIVFVDYRGLTVSQDTALRAELRKANIEYKVLKNRLVLRALNQAGHAGFDKVLEGPTAVAFSYDDVVAPAKILASNGETTKKLALKGGLVEGSIMDATQIMQLSKIPAKEVLIGQLLGMLQSPIRSLAVALDQIASK